MRGNDRKTESWKRMEGRWSALSSMLTLLTLTEGIWEENAPFSSFPRPLAPHPSLP